MGLKTYCQGVTSGGSNLLVFVPCEDEDGAKDLVMVDEILRASPSGWLKENTQ